MKSVISFNDSLKRLDDQSLMTKLKAFTHSTVVDNPFVSRSENFRSLATLVPVLSFPNQTINGYHGGKK